MFKDFNALEIFEEKPKFEINLPVKLAEHLDCISVSIFDHRAIIRCPLLLSDGYDKLLPAHRILRVQGFTICTWLLHAAENDINSFWHCVGTVLAMEGMYKPELITGQGVEWND